MKIYIKDVSLPVRWHIRELIGKEDIPTNTNSFFITDFKEELRYVKKIQMFDSPFVSSYSLLPLLSFRTENVLPCYNYEGKFFTIKGLKFKIVSWDKAICLSDIAHGSLDGAEDLEIYDVSEVVKLLYDWYDFYIKGIEITEFE